MLPEHARTSHRLALAAQVAVVLVYLAGAAVFLWFGDLNQDEGYILHAARRAMQGLMPVRDFFFVQTPVQPYLYGAALSSFGITILGGRVLTTLFALGALLLAMGLAARLTRSPWGGALAGLLVVLFADMTYHNTISKTHAQTAFFLMLGMWLTLADGPERPWRQALAVVLMFLATATRLTAAAPALVLVVWLIARREWSRPVTLAGAAVALAAVVWVMAVGPERAWLNLVGYHLPNQPRPAWHLEMSMAQHLGLVAGALLNTFRRYLLVLAPPLVALVIRRTAGPAGQPAPLTPGDARGARDGGEALPAAWLLVGAGVVLYLAHAPAGGFGHFYFSMSLPMVAAGASVFLFDLARRLKLQPGRRTLLAVACALLLASALAEAVYETRYRCTFSGETQLAQLQRVAGIVREVVPPGEELLTFSPYLAVEAGRDVPLSMSMAWWCYYPDLSTEQCREWGVVNGELLVRMVAEQRVPAVAITDAMREKIIGRPGSEVLLEMLTSKWKVHWAEDHFGQLQTRLSIWVPREGGR